MVTTHRTHMIASAVLLLGAAAAPAAAQSGMGGMSGMTMNQTSGYMAMLAPPSGATSGPRGMVTVNGTAVKLTISGGNAGDALPWHLHNGTCGDDKGVVATTQGYAPASVGTDGKASATAVLTAPLVGKDGYFAAVHASASDMNVIACAALKPGKM